MARVNRKQPAQGLGTVTGLTAKTNILEIDVPPRLRERHKCGIGWVDTAFGGDCGEGFVPSCVHMLTGMPGTGKSTFVRQLADAITKQGHLALYNSGEESLYQVKMSCERMNLKSGFYVGNHTLVPELLKHADVLMKAYPRKQIFMLQDSLPTLDDGFYKNGVTNSATPVRVCDMLVKWAKDNFGIMLFINQSTKGGEYVGKGTIKHAVDGHADFYFDKDKKSETYGERLFTVEKNRFGLSGRTHIIGLNSSGIFEKGSFNFADV